MMDIRLQPLILWTDRDVLRRTIPECFRSNFGDKVTISIDCYKVFVLQSSTVFAKACTWSSYKHHNTI